MKPPVPGINVGGGVPTPVTTPGTPVIETGAVGSGWPGEGNGIHCGTSQHVGSLGSGTIVQPTGTFGYLAHL